METQSIKEKQFSFKVCSEEPLKRGDRDFLSDFVMDEIQHGVGVDIIVDDVFEERYAEEYIVSGSVSSAQRLKESVEGGFDYRVVCREVYCHD